MEQKKNVEVKDMCPGDIYNLVRMSFLSFLLRKEDLIKNQSCVVSQ